LSAKGNSDALAERLYSCITEEVLAKNAITAAALPPTAEEVGGASSICTKQEVAVCVSPMHSVFASVATVLVENSCDKSKPFVFFSASKTNVFGKLLREGKKLLKAKQTPVKATVASATEIVAEAVGQDASGPAHVQVCAVHEDAAFGAIQKMPQLDIPLGIIHSTAFAEAAVSTSDRHEAVSDQVHTSVKNEASKLASDHYSDTNTSGFASTVEICQTESVGSDGASCSASSPPCATDIAGVLRESSTQPQTPLASPVRSMIKSPLQMSPLSDMETSPAKMALTENTSAMLSREIVEVSRVSLNTPATSNQTESYVASTPHPNTFQQQGDDPGAAVAKKTSVPVDPKASLKPAPHALKLEQIREKQKAAKLQKEKERLDKDAEREARIQAQKEKAEREKLLQKQALKEKAKKNLEEYEGRAAPDELPIQRPQVCEHQPETEPESTELNGSSEIQGSDSTGYAGERAQIIEEPLKISDVSLLVHVPTQVQPTPLASAAALAAELSEEPLSAQPLAFQDEATKITNNLKQKVEEEAQRRAEEAAAVAVAQAAAEDYDSYCMSEPEEQEAENSEEEDQKGKPPKRVPAWANRENLKPALKQQAELKIDPDGIFFECNTCNLEDIFERSSKR
jgi:hypothetical protein